MSVSACVFSWTSCAIRSVSGAMGNEEAEDLSSRWKEVVVVVYKRGE